MAVHCGVDSHSRQQFVMWCDTHDGEIHERQLTHQSLDDVRSFYAQFSGEVIVGIEASGYSEWFENVLRELGHQVRVGDATAIRRRARPRQKTDRTRVERELAELAAGDERVRRLRTHPGIGLLTGLALVHTPRPVSRFADSRKVTAYVGLEPREHSSGERRRMGHISKAGSRVLRFLLVEAGNSAVRSDEPLRRLYYRVLRRRDRARAKVAVARHVLVHAYVMLRDEIDYAEFRLRGANQRSTARTVHRPEVPDRLVERPAPE